MTRRASIAALLHAIDQRSPAGFAIALHIRFTRPTYLFQTYSKRWMDHYSRSGLMLHDPLVRWGLQNVGSRRWSDLEAIDEMGVLEQAKDFGLMNGAVVAVLHGGSRTIAGFARADRDYEDAEIDELESLIDALHRSTVALESLSAGDRKALTDLSVRLTH